MIRKSRIKTIHIEISDIFKTTDKGICVIVKQTGKKLWLPAKHIDFLPGLVIVPLWLMRRIKKNE